MSTTIKNFINHICFVVDRSGSMSHLSNQVVNVFDDQVKFLAKRSKELDQEVRASVYLFNTATECVLYDTDVLRLPSLKDLYRAGGGTALIRATHTVIDELKQTAQLHGDHAFLVYVLTDGGETEQVESKYAIALKAKIDALAVNWTTAVLVPNKNCEALAERQGFVKDNILIWDTTAKGLNEAASTLQVATNNYMVARSAGVRGTKSLFRMDTSKIESRKVSDNLDSLNANQYELLDVDKEQPIKPFVEKKLGTYVKGNSFYQLVKTEEIQSYKRVAIQNKISQRVWSGDNARQILGLPNTNTKIAPESGASKFHIFIQSTSLNRKLAAGTKLLVLK